MLLLVYIINLTFLLKASKVKRKYFTGIIRSEFNPQRNPLYTYASYFSFSFLTILFALPPISSFPATILLFFFFAFVTSIFSFLALLIFIIFFLQTVQRDFWKEHPRTRCKCEFSCCWWILCLCTGMFFFFFFFAESIRKRKLQP